MNNDDDKKLNSFFKKNGFSVAVCSTIAVMMVASLYFSYNSISKTEDVEEITENLQVNKSDVKSYTEIEVSTQATTEDLKKTEIVTETEEVTEATTNNEEAKAPSSSSNPEEIETSETEAESVEPSQNEKAFNEFQDGQEMSWPVSGRIVMNYSADTAIYDKTLDLYRTNTSIAIEAVEGTDVLASAGGIVENIFLDDEKGTSVVVNHGNGWLSTYSQLRDNVSVSIGDVVSEGQTIGSVGVPSNYSVSLGSHLDFKLTKDDISSDPTLILAQLNE